MTRKTRDELKASIRHWNRLATGTTRPGEDTSGKFCALCKLFYSLDGCGQCPVKLRTGKSFCLGSPWADARDAYEDDGLESKEFKSAARKELDFLKSLLPKGRRK